MIIIAFDFGMRNIGTAVGNSILKSASALKTLKANNGKPNWQQIADLIDNWQASTLIVGLPLTIDGENFAIITKSAKLFAEKLKFKFKLPTFLTEEALSTIEARAQIFSEGGYKKLQKTEIDSIAAKLIAEQWLYSNVK